MTSEIKFPSANKSGDCPASIYGDPKTLSKGLIVLHEWWGKNEQMQNCGKELSQMGGVVTLVPDFYRGKTTTDHEEAGHFMGDLDWKGAVADVQAAARYLKQQGVKKVGVTGFCMGGALALASGVLVPEIDAAMPFYGIPPADLCDVTTIKIPLQCHFALKDESKGFASPTEWRPLKAKLEKAQLKNFQFHEYDTGHAFTNRTSAGFNKEACDLAFKRLFEFFNALS